MRDYPGYLLARMRSTWLCTRESIKTNAPAGIFYPAFSFAAGASMSYRRNPSDTYGAVTAGLSVCVIAAVMMFLAILATHYIRSSYRLWKKDGDVLLALDDEIMRAMDKIERMQGPAGTASGPPQPDVTLVEAVYYIAFGQWGVSSVVDEHGGYKDAITQVRLLKAIDAARHAAGSGRLPVWGEVHDSYGRPLNVEIRDPAKYWQSCWPAEDFFKYNSREEIPLEHISDRFSNRDRGYDWFYTHRQSVEMLWPAENIPAPNRPRAEAPGMA